MKSSYIDHSNFLSLAWEAVRPYLLEMPPVFLEDHTILRETKYAADTLTSFEPFVEYAANLGINPGVRDPYSGMSISVAISRTPRFKKLRENRRLSEIYTVTNILNCFINLFSTRDADLKDEYRELLSNEFYDYKMISFYHAATHDLMFESFRDMILYFDELCGKFTFNAILTKGMLEIFCTMMPSVISRQYNTQIIMAPTFAYKGLLPLFATKESVSGFVNLFCSAAISRCFMQLSSDVIYNDEAPFYVDFILKRLVGDLSRPAPEMFSAESIFNNDITALNLLSPAKNIFTLTKSFNISNSQIEIFSYDKDLESCLITIKPSNNPLAYYIISKDLLAANKAPMDLEILSRFSLSKNGEANELTDKENAIIDEFMKNMSIMLDM